MDLPIEAIKWIVVIGLIYYILDKTPIGVPLKKGMVRLMLWLWSRAKTSRVNPELNKEMNRLGVKYGWDNPKKRTRKKETGK
jgi:hypothetical protein